MSRLLAGNSPGSKLVWRNICCHGARGLCHDGGTSSLLIDDSNVKTYGVLSRLLCKYCDKQITTTDRVIVRCLLIPLKWRNPSSQKSQDGDLFLAIF